MSQTYFGSGLRSGTDALSDTVDGGYVTLAQSAVVTSLASGAAASGSIKLPAGSQIIEIYADKIVDWAVGGGTATALNVAVGSSAGGTQYMPTTDMASVARTAGTLVVADVAAMANIGNNTTVYFTVDPDGTVVTTQAQIQFTVIYANKA